jgi:hypothetical protein
MFPQRCNALAGSRLKTRRPGTSVCGRVAGFERSALTTALVDRLVIQATLMRCTIHMVAADDFWPMCAGVRSARRDWWLRTARTRKLAEVDQHELARLLRRELEGGP